MMSYSNFNSSPKMTPYFLEHHVKDKEVWFTKFNEILDKAEGKSLEQIKAMPMYEINQPILCCSSVDFDITCCLWLVRKDQTTDDFQEFIDDFTGPSVVNRLFKIESSCGVDTVLTVDKYFQDFTIMRDNGVTNGFSTYQEVFVVIHDIHDKNAWDKWIADGFKMVTDVKDYKGLQACFGYPPTFECLAYLNLSGTAAACIWACPNGTDIEEFQSAMDETTGSSSRNRSFKLEQELSISIGNLSNREYAKHVLSTAGSLIKQGEIASNQEKAMKRKSSLELRAY